MEGPLPDVPVVPAEAIAAAAAAGLRYASDATPGLRRLGVPGRFRYVDAQGRPVRDPAVIRRIQALAIPPAYVDVWICPSAEGHLQATGRDARGRKQYRYHAQWRAMRDTHKFERMIAFGEALPRLRRRVRRDLDARGLPQAKVLALIVALLDATRIRIGNRVYARDNNSFGLTTLRGRHVTFMGGRLRLQFRGKGGAEHDLELDDRRILRVVRRCQELPGQHLFQFLDDDGVRHRVDSDMVNAYLGEATGEAFTAKDFRTWGATLRAIALMAATPLPERPSERAMKACVVAAIKTVAAELRNTPAVCRKSYINPVVFEGWREGRLHRMVAVESTRAPRKMDKLALRFLRGEARRTTRSSSAPPRRSARGGGSVRS